MSRLRRIEIIEPSYPTFLLRESTIFAPKTLALPSCFADEDLDFSHALDFLNPSKSKPNPFELFDTITDLTQIEKTPFCSSYKRVQIQKPRVGLGTELYLQSLSDRVTALETSYDRLVKEKLKKLDRKYTWTAESKDRKYTWTEEIKGEKKKKKKKNTTKDEVVKEKKEKKKEEEKNGVAKKKNYKWTAEIKGKGDEGHPIVRTYTFQASSGDAGSESSGSEKEDHKKKKEKKEKKEKKSKKDTRTVEIEEVDDHGAYVLRQAFAKRDNGKGKKKELSPLDAANMIQMSFKAYLIRRSQSLRALRELAIAKTKLKELRGLFHNFAYRRHVSRDAEERQKFSEKIIVLLLTVDAIEGADIMVRCAKRSMVDELEAMLEVVDPQPMSKSLSMRRRTFDLPTGGIQKEIAAGVAKVVQMLDEEENGSNSTFEACL